MEQLFDIIATCRISDKEVLVNQESILHHSQENEQDWLSNIYHHIGMQYPKFFKMDRLCKAGILGAELLLNNYTYDQAIVKADWGIILMNAASSLDNDRHYQETISEDNYYPSPSVFVYTLANIVTGEIAIRHKIGGESSFYVMPDFDEQLMQELANQSFISNPELTHLICGWVNVDQNICDVRMHLYRRSVETLNNIPS